MELGLRMGMTVFEGSVKGPCLSLVLDLDYLLGFVVFPFVNSRFSLFRACQSFIFFIFALLSLPFFFSFFLAPWSRRGRHRSPKPLRLYVFKRFLK